MKDLNVYAVIGVLDHERQKEQLVVANLIIKYKKNDSQFINYADIATKVANMLKNNKYMLLEDALSDIVEAIYNNFNYIKSIRFKLDKPEILDNCIVGVELFRKF